MLLKVQIACYPGQATRYVRHLDAFKGGANRRLTVLYYLNTEWQNSHGGQLRIWGIDGKSDNYKDIEPIADRLLIFQSRTIEHEVLPSQKKRFSITMWFY